ncbi:glycoside hydrolase family 25 protein [Bifidobacterium adolescentis]|uniref:glycoside hydrolase family 25 protein n=1 Tax=Bifidobacterium adolescentis TaxID=1680 RepID=UPI00165E515F|nr:glycoside hydrolase family 25 protein [Bifidobacterium adolescentis]MBC9858650.1 1,4-beta-N-acetylmuramidase [Bifidobacterium adolescentis]
MISPKSLMKIATTASVVAMTVSVAVVPAYAMQDIAIEDTPSSFAATVDDVQNSSNSMPDNPNATLPETVSENISDDSTVVSENLAVTPEGDVQNIETGETVTDAQLVGTQSQQPDPLAKTDGESFIPVSASDVKDAVEQPVKQSAEQSSSKNGATVKLAKFDGNDYGAHWGTYNNTKAFFDYKNNLFAQQAKGVIDVSSWQGDIDWAKAKADGVEGAIIRLGFGWDNDADAKAQRNIAECKRLGIPFGIYWYSYAEDVDGAKHEGNDVVSKLRQMGVSPSDLKYPVYYDLERWTWTGHTPPTNPNVYNGIVNAWYGALQSGGYQNLGVYSYTSYLQGPLNNANIYAKTRWVAQYGARIEFTAFGTNDRGWQYTESGQINGISGSVDMSAFGNKEFESSIDLTWIVRSEDIAVGAAVKDVTRALEYKWMSYDVNADRWKTISDWSTSNWAGWSDNEGTYWLHCEVRDIYSKKEIGEQTIAFAYAPGYRRINGTYAGYEGNGILLGVNSNNPKGKYEIKIYDTQKKTWVAGWNGQWAHWYPRKGIYWTHFELYTSDGFLTETKTYAFGV